MTVSTHKEYISTGDGTGVADNDGGVILHGGNIASSRHTTKNDHAWADTDIAGVYGSQLFTNTDDLSGQPGLTTAHSSGAFAYNPNGRGVTRSSPNTGFLIRGGSPTLIGGRASTGDILAIAASDAGTRRSIHFTERRYQEGTWATRIFNLCRNPTAASTNNHGLLQSDGTDKAGITSRGSAQQHNAIDNENNNIDNAARPTRAIPGEFVILQNFVSYTGTSTSGDGSSSETMMDYSALTG